MVNSEDCGVRASKKEAMDRAARRDDDVEFKAKVSEKSLI